MSSHTWCRAALVLLFSLLAACGGGGGGSADGAGAPTTQAPVPSPEVSSSSAGVSFDPPLLKASFAELGQTSGAQFNPPGQRVTARFTTPPDGPFYAIIAQDRPVLDGTLRMVQSTSDSLSAFLPYSRSLPAGEYTGSITLLLCGDLRCESMYPGSGAKLPYSFTVTPGIHLTISINGQRIDARPVPARHGDLLQVVANMPVNWGPFTSSGGFTRDLQETPTTYTATVGYGVSPPGSLATYEKMVWTEGLETRFVLNILP